MKQLTPSELQNVTGGVTPLADFGQFFGGSLRGFLFSGGNSFVGIAWGLAAAYYL